MTFANDDTGVALPLPVLEAMDRLCDEFETALLANSSPTIDACLARIDERYRPTAYRELLALELAYLGNTDQQPRAEADYASRYPAYAAVTRQVFASLQNNGRVDANPQAIPPSRPSIDALRSNVAHNAADDQLPEKIGKYRVVARLGSGGQGVVYRAVHPTLSHDVVVKVSHRRFDAEEAILGHLIQEGKVLAELDHPNLVRVHDLDFDEGRPYLVMDLVRGQNLRQHASIQRISPIAAAGLIQQLAHALAVVHRHGVLHLDIKPENIIVDDHGNPRLVDFGLAKLLMWWTKESQAEGAFRGTAAFASPEQASGNSPSIDQRSDLFSLAAVLYFLLVGMAPYHDAEWSTALSKAKACNFDRQALNRGIIPYRLAAICLRAMSRDPKDRHCTADELANDLQRVLRSPKACGMRTAVVGCLAALFLAGSAYLASSFLMREIPHADSPADTNVALMRLPPSQDSAQYVKSCKEGATPEWDRQARELRLDGRVIRRVKSLRVAANVVAVLDSFQSNGWQRRIAYPFEGEVDRQRLNDSVRSLNDGLEGIRFRVDGEGPGILWLPASDTPKSSL